jgi:hypothetical protein
MPESGFKLPVEVEKEAGPLLADLRAGGWQVSASEYDASAFGNWLVDLRRDEVVMRLLKDRSQYMVTGLPKGSIEGSWAMAGIRQSKRFADDRRQMGQSVPRLINFLASRVLERR